MSKELTILSLLKEQLIGGKLKHKNKYNRQVTLEVEDVRYEHHSVQITPDTPENDWWGETKDWTTLKIYFFDGSSIEVNPNVKFEIE